MAWSSKQQAIAAGAVTSLVTFTAGLLIYAKRNQAELADYGTRVATPIAEEAAKSYIATNFGLTPEILRRITDGALVRTITTLSTLARG